MTGDVQVDTENWSGEGTFTQVLIDRLQTLNSIALLRVEDAPATRSDAGYSLISNEVYVGFRLRERRERVRRLGIFPATRLVLEPAMTMAELESALAGMAEVGPPDYSDDSMLQYLKTERIVPPYQTRGYKLIELVRLYRMDVGRQGRPPAR